MKLNALIIFSSLSLGAVNAEKLNRRHIAKRQAGLSDFSAPATSPPVVSTTAVSTSTSSPLPSSSVTVSTPAPAVPEATTQSATIISSPITATNENTTLSSTSLSGQPPVLTTTAPSGPPPLATGTGIPPLANITLGMPTRAAMAAQTTFAAGSKPPLQSAPVIPAPAASAYSLSSWPAQDKIPPTDSAEVREWMKELDGFNIPDLSLTVNGSCALSPTQAADAANRGWWTCGGHTRVTDIVACPTKYDWGVSFDDGPSGYTQYLLNYLEEKKIDATFFVVGSRVIERPALLIEEYMSGHEISVHTWSHSALTNLTNEQIVAELGWTRKAIKTFLGVTPTTMRPPYGDIDDRVRAIAMAMGMVPIMWTRSPSGAQFDTNDWRVAGGLVAGNDSFASFEQILGNASMIDTGFIVLQHDLYEISVDLAVGYTLDAALSHNPKFNLKSIGSCSGIPEGNMYLETNANTTFPFSNRTGVDVSGDGTVDTKSGDGGKTAEGLTDTKTGAAIKTVPFISSIGVGLAALSILL